MLPLNYRISALNESGANVDIVVTARRWKFDANSVVAYEPTEATLLNQSAVIDTSFTVGDPQNNGAGAFLGASLLVATTGTGTAGVITLFLDVSTDGGNTFGTLGKGIPIGSLKAGETKPMTI